MNQTLIDLLRDELPESEAALLRARLEREPELRREFEEMRSLFALVRRGEEIEPSPALRERVLQAAAARRRRAPGAWLEALRGLPALVTFRFRHSRLFRVAMISAAAHLLLLAFLFHRMVLSPETPGRIAETILQAHPDGELLPAAAIRPDRAFLIRLRQRQVPHGQRLAAVGIPGQAEAIARGVRALLEAQAADGSFETLEGTGQAALVLLAEGATSLRPDPLGRALARAIRNLHERMDREGSSGAGVAALIEDYVLCWDAIAQEERSSRLGSILRALRSLPDGESCQEALVLAQLAGLSVPAELDPGAARFYRTGPRDALLQGPATRIAATAALARGPDRLDPEAVRAWVAPLFRSALDQLASHPADALALLTLQAPYRL
ncbi:MAG: hypothetical protein ACT4PV_04260 [Planctomycetaceae bacterium]